MRRVLLWTALCAALACGGEQSQPSPSAPEIAAAPAPSGDAPKAVPPTTPGATSTQPLGAQIGQPAPDFSLKDTDGQTFSLSAQRGKVVVLEWFNPDCPFVKHARGKGPLRELAKQRQSDELVWLSINSGAPGNQGHGIERNKAAKSEYGMVNPVLLDETGQVGRSYGALKTPHMFVIDEKGVLVYRGGLDNAPMGVVDDARPRAAGTQAGELSPYLITALDEVTQGRAISLADTPAYGCSVKYAD
jgi:peroxiredoxin